MVVSCKHPQQKSNGFYSYLWGSVSLGLSNHHTHTHTHAHIHTHNIPTNTQSNSAVPSVPTDITPMMAARAVSSSTFMRRAAAAGVHCASPASSLLLPDVAGGGGRRGSLRGESAWRECCVGTEKRDQTGALRLHAAVAAADKILSHEKMSSLPLSSQSMHTHTRSYTHTHIHKQIHSHVLCRHPSHPLAPQIRLRPRHSGETHPPPWRAHRRHVLLFPFHTLPYKHTHSYKHSHTHTQASNKPLQTAL